MKHFYPPYRRPLALAGAGLALTLLVMTGCASKGSPLIASVPDEAQPISYIVKAGDSLAAIARQFTGDPNRWPAIATHNDLEDPTRLEIGQRIEIPAELLSSEAVEPVSRREQAPMPVPDSVTRAVKMPGSRAGAAAAEVPSLSESDAAVKLTAVDPNRDFELDPLDNPSVGAVPRTVRVIGTYYPVALYVEPRNGARLARRVTPGTMFPLERELDGWWQVNTGTSAVYLRRGDGELVPGSARADN